MAQKAPGRSVSENKQSADPDGSRTFVRHGPSGSHLQPNHSRNPLDRSEVGVFGFVRVSREERSQIGRVDRALGQIDVDEPYAPNVQ